MTVIVKVECPDQPVKVKVVDTFNGQPYAQTTRWVRRNETEQFSVWQGKTLTITEYPEEHPEDKP